MLLTALVLFVSRDLLHATANLHYGTFKPINIVPTTATYTASSALGPHATRFSTTSAYAQQKGTWPSTVTHHNWFILQATANTAVATVAATEAETEAEVEAVAVKSANQQQPHRMALGEQPHSLRLNNYATQINQQQHQRQQLPVNYYTYNSSSSGNYHSMQQNVRIVEPYVLAITNHLTTGGSTGGAVNNRIRRGHIKIKQNNHNNEGESKLKKDESKENIAPKILVPNNVNTVSKQPQVPALFSWQDIDSGNANGNSHGVHIYESVEDVGSMENDLNSLEDQQIDEVLIPLGKVLDKIKHFCELWKQIINEAGVAASSDLDTAATSTIPALAEAADEITAAGDTAAQLPAEVQGRRSAPPVAATAAQSSMQQSLTTAAASYLWPKPRPNAVTASTAASTKTFNTAAVKAKSLTTAAVGIGRGKKWKKKLKNLMFPLLLAYKLKFFALVPLLISGLTLLVGSTGLAGFFFALFITVMSLKGSGNKSVVIKKDL